MQMPLRIILLLTIMPLLPPQLYAQQIVVNNQGERIVVYPDGSWRVMTPADSVYLQKDTASMPPDARVDTAGADTLEPWPALLRRIDHEYAAAQAAFRLATNLQFKAAEANRNAQENAALLSPEQRQGFEDAYAASVERLARARKREKAIAAIHADAQRVSGDIPGPGSKSFERLRINLSDYLDTYLPGAPALSGSGPPDENENVVNVREERDRSSTRTPACTLSRDAVDPMTGFRVRETTLQPLFFHTDPELRPFFKNKDLITCRASLTGNGPSTTLMLTFEIASANSQASFGGIAQGALLRLKLMDGSLLTLYNQANDRGRIDAYSGHTVFTARYPIGREELRQLEQAELDKVRVLWIAGYEDYEIIYTDCIRDQLACLAAE
jgi:hypothetical protein